METELSRGRFESDSEYIKRLGSENERLREEQRSRESEDREKQQPYYWE